MHVLATAGHVDHGKSTLVRALTGMESDRLAEEHRRGLSIELGYCWTTLDGVGEVAFVDVPGHERFLTTALAGVGPVPAVLFVVAADDPWMPQAAEHLTALDALGVEHAVLAVTRSDLADPAPMLARGRAELAATSLKNAEAVAVSARTGAGLDELREALGSMLHGLPVPDTGADVRMWVDRRFTVRGAGTVVTGTLPAGTVRVQDTLACGESTVRVRGVQTLGRAVDAVSGTARVALNLAGRVADDVRPGTALTTPQQWQHTGIADVRLVTYPTAPLPAEPMLHVGSAALQVRVRPLGPDTSGLIRLILSRELPLRVGDRAVLRDPGSRAVWGATVLDPAPPPLGRRGAAAARAADLADADGSAAQEVRRRGLVSRSFLARIGVPVEAVPDDTVELAGWMLSGVRARELTGTLVAEVAEHAAHAGQLDLGLPVTALAARLGVPEEVLAALATAASPSLTVTDGRILASSTRELPGRLRESYERLRQDLESDPFAAPGAHRLAELGLDAKALAALARAGLVLRLDETTVLLPEAESLAHDRLAELPQPFTASQARTALGTSRRVALPLLARLDRTGTTLRLPDDRRRLRRE
ncbi:MAG TPA: SelB C-terminal domain-containing protein [Nocardioidaceae bacterium]|nr:SelB C-terminal domain-containing protein [Nocardioidaceae bacterium]